MLERLFRMWVMFQRARFFVWVNLVALCVYEWVARWEPPQPVFASKTSAPDFSGHTMRARGQLSMLCRIKGRHEALRQSLFWPETELAPWLGKETVWHFFCCFFFNLTTGCWTKRQAARTGFIFTSTSQARNSGEPRGR